MSSKWALDRYAKNPIARQAIHDFETREKRPIRLGPVPVVQPIKEWKLTLNYDWQFVLSINFQNAPPILQPRHLFEEAWRHLGRMPKTESLARLVLAAFLEKAQYWVRKDWDTVLRECGIPVQSVEKALAEGIPFNVRRV